MDGKSARGSRHGDIPAAHLLAAITGTGMTVTQLRVPAKTNEITCFAALLAPYDLTGVVVTADALHTQRDHARFLVEDKKAHYAFTVKGNQKGLHHQLRALPWTKASAKFYDRTEGHGRLETRVVQALTVAGLGVDFPHAAQVAKITRYRTNSKTGKRTRETVYVITDLTSRQASPNASRRSPARSGPSRTGSTSSATPPSPKTPPKSEPSTARRTWPPCAASPSTSCEQPARRTSPPPSARCPTSRSTAH
ncbi:ISAs1 family transposase [Streptomyces sp. AD2-2]|nr:ISAs1 family transposase [Streptomyces sp. AD2-2]